MELPRWTAWPALALIFALALTAVPRPVRDFEEAASPRAAPPAKSRYPRVVVLGIDGLDPELLQAAIDRFPERMQHFARLARENGLHALGTSTPPQSPVAWSNFITGLNPGGHGVYDFLHRDPVTRAPIPGSVKSEASDPIHLWSDWQFPRGGESESNRSGKAFWQLLADHGVPADIWRMPANFPVESSKGLSFSGMMTPALDSAYGACTLYTTDPPPTAGLSGGRVIGVTEYGGRVDTYLSGPPNSFKQGSHTETRVPLTLHIDRANGAAAVDVAGAVLVLRPGEWSDFVQVDFALLPLHAMDISGVVRFYLRRLEPEIELYASPVNIDPLAPVMPVSSPEGASADLADRSQGGIGIYYTQGMPEDVNALKHRLLDEREFMAQSKLVHDEGTRMMDYALDQYLARPEGGFLFFYFSGVDLCSHMMWRLHDPGHPHHDAELAAEDSQWWSDRQGSTWKDVVVDLYLQLDPVVGHLRERLGEDATLIVISDHGFASYGREFNLNTWLWQEGYLVLKEGVDPALEKVELFGSGVDWSRTRAYGIGFNGLYLNLAGRELDNPKTDDAIESGIVQPGAEAEALLAEIAAKLEAIVDPERNGRQVVVRADLARDVYQGERAAEAPDIVVGYNSDYGNSDDASLGRVDAAVLRDNLGGTFNGSHLMAPEVVPGTLLSNRPVEGGSHRLEDVTAEILGQYGIELAPGMQGHPVLRRADG